MKYEVHIVSPHENAIIVLSEVSESDATDIAEIMTRYGATVSLLAKPKE
nr:MAG TPA: hypothetical protein [Caudoviricetes sp.]